MARSLHLSFICIPQSTRALDQGGDEPRQAVSPKALRPWTIPLCYSVAWAPKISLNDGRYVIRPFECKIIGQAEGLARVKFGIHTLFTTFDDEEWRVITLFVNHLDSQLKYTDLFAASCGSLGEFSDIKQSEGSDRAILAERRSQKKRHQAERRRLCYDSANETFQFSCTQS